MHKCILLFCSVVLIQVRTITTHVYMSTRAIHLHILHVLRLLQSTETPQLLFDNASLKIALKKMYKCVCINYAQ